MANLTNVKATTFSSKIRNLNDFHNHVVNSSSLTASTSGTEVVLALNYFSQELLSVLRDVTADENIPPAPNQPTNNPFATVHRIRIFPTLSYTTLYHSLLSLLEIVPCVQINQVAVGESLLKTFECLCPFLSDDLLESLPYTISLSLTTFPKDLHKAIVDCLCNTILPISLYSDRSTNSFTTNSIPSIIMLVLQYANDTAFNVQLFECLLSLKRNLIQDILCSIAYGSYKVRYHATNLLFRYWPRLNPNKADRNIHYHVKPRRPLMCHSDKCSERRNLAYKVCIPPHFSIHGTNFAPPYNLCNECCREIPKRFQSFSNNIVGPVESISTTCQSKACLGLDNPAHVVCYSSPCIIANDNRPVALCLNCHNTQHANAPPEHTWQEYPTDFWTIEAKTRTYLSLAMLSLLQEVPLQEGRREASGTGGLLTNKGDLTNLIGVGLIGALNTNGFSNTSALASNLFASGSSSDESAFNKRLLSRFACYLIVQLVPASQLPPDLPLFGRLVACLLQWFHAVCYVPSDASGELVAKLRSLYVLPWLRNVTDRHFEVVAAAFLPYSPTFTQVGGVWERRCSLVTQLKLEFAKFADLIPYEVVNADMWHLAMPFWLDALLNECNDSLGDLRSLFSKLFDPDMTPFDLPHTYKFVTERLEGTSSLVQEQALSWLQLLCELDVAIPVGLLLDAFHSSINSLQKLELRALRRREASQSLTSDSLNTDHLQQMLPAGASFTVFDTYDAYKVYRNQLMLQRMTGQELAALIKEEEEDFVINNSELNVTCCIMQLDMVLKQLELQYRSSGSLIQVSKDLLSLLNKHLVLPWIKRHRCRTQLVESPILSGAGPSATYCPFCEDHVVWFTFAKQILEKLMPRQELDLPECNFHALHDALDMQETIRNARSSLPQKTIQALGGSLTNELCSLPVLSAISSETVTLTPKTNPDNEREEEGGQDLIKISTENETITKSSNEAIEDKAPVSPPPQPKKTNPDAGIWVTSDGIYYFKLAQLAPQHQLFYSLLKELYRIVDVDAFYHLLLSLKLLVVHGDCLDSAAKEQKGFLIYSLEKMLIPNLWRLLSASYCHLNSCAVPILIHSLVHESGQATFCSLVQADFTDTNWKTRMQAISRVVAIAQHLECSKMFKSHNHHIFSSLSMAFSRLIHATLDSEPTVAQKAVSLIDTLTNESLRSVLAALQLQFDCVISDRPYLLKTLRLLYTQHRHRASFTLTWEILARRFNTLSIEAQLSNDPGQPVVDIYGHTEKNNTYLQCKVSMAKVALKRSATIRRVSPESTQVDPQGDQVLSELVSLLMTFMATCDDHPVSISQNISPDQPVTITSPGMPSGQNTINHLFNSSATIPDKHQTVLLRHIESLMHFNSSDQKFTTNHHLLHENVCVNAFLVGLPALLDRNLDLGRIMLPTVLSLLRYLPASNPTIDPPTCTLGLIDFQARHYWLQTLIIVFYKYEFSASTNLASCTRSLIQIVLNTLNGQHHKCDLAELLEPSTSDGYFLPNSNHLDDQVDSSSISRRFTVLSLSSHPAEAGNLDSAANRRCLIDGLNQKKRRGRFIRGVRRWFGVDSTRRLVKKKPTLAKSGRQSMIKLTRRSRIARTILALFRSKQRKKLKINKKLQRTNIGLTETDRISDRRKRSSGLPAAIHSRLNLLYRRQASSGHQPDLSDWPRSLDGANYICCERCGALLETYDEATLGSLVVVCSTLLHRDTHLAAPFVLEMLLAAMRLANKKQYNWQASAKFFLPANYNSVARQFLRCTLHKLQNNEILFQLFQCVELSNEPVLLETLSSALADWTELSAVAALRQLFADLNKRLSYVQKAPRLEVLLTVLTNAATYTEYLSFEAQASQWTAVASELETLLRGMEPLLVRDTDLGSVFRLVAALLRTSAVVKQLLESFASLITFALRHCQLRLAQLVDVCALSTRAFGRNRQYLAKAAVAELATAVTVKVGCRDRNLLLVLQLAVLDAGGCLATSALLEPTDLLYSPYMAVQTNAADALKVHLEALVAFVADIHGVNRVRRDLRLDSGLQSRPGADECLGAELKAGLAQFLALEFTELNKSKDRDSRSLVKHLPWLSNLPTNHQNGAKEFVECIDHIRFLSWILIGSLTHSALTRNQGTVIAYPIPINCGHYIGEHVFYILNGFAEHSKTSAIHMSSLFHSFILCQLWTMYCEQIHVTFDVENESSALSAIMEFWSKITPGILQLLSQTKVLTDMVTLHFLSLIEGLQQYNSLVLAKFFPMWVPVLFMTHLQGDQLKRAKQCLNYQPPADIQLNAASNYDMLLKCLQRLQYKIAMIEQQSSNAAMLYN